MNPRLIALVGLLVAGCGTRNQNSLLVITKVLPGKFTPAAGTTPAFCAVEVGDKEFDYLTLNPTEGRGHVSLVVDNRISPSVAVNTALRTESADFIPLTVVVDYEDATSGVNLKRTSSPALAGSVPNKSAATVGVFLFPAGLNGAAVGDYVRTLVHLEGKLLDGSRVSTAEHEYIFQLCGAAGCSSSPCLL